MYFIKNGHGSVKIGYAKEKSFKDLVRNLQAANDTKLEVLLTIPGDCIEEDILFNYFYNKNIVGSWFELGGAVQEFIDLQEDERRQIIKNWILHSYSDDEIREYFDLGSVKIAEAYRDERHEVIYSRAASSD